MKSLVQRLRDYNLDGTGNVSVDVDCDEAAATIDRLTARIATLKKALARKRCLISWAYYTLKEINVSNYTHDDVCNLNSASVEVILGLKPEIEIKPLGETP